MSHKACLRDSSICCFVRESYHEGVIRANIEEMFIGSVTEFDKNFGTIGLMHGQGAKILMLV